MLLRLFTRRIKDLTDFVLPKITWCWVCLVFFAALLKNGMYSPRQTGFSGTATVNKVMLVLLNNLFSMFPANDQLPLGWTQNMARCQKVPKL